MNIVVLCGGVGAARFLLGLDELAHDHNISAVVNTGDDDMFYGQYVCPDIDSIMYHLSGLHDEVRGWGRKNETFHFVETLRELGQDAWFNLGDRDFALNYFRTSLLADGISLRDATQILCESLAINNFDIIPMCDQKVTTMITTDNGKSLRMQEYFVREHCAPKIAEVTFDNIPTSPHADVATALEDADKIVIAPSNPYLSIDPIIAINQVHSFLASHKEKVTAISPIISGRSVKGPLAEIMAGRGVDVSPVSIARHYRDVAQTILIDDQDKELVETIEQMGYLVLTTNIMLDENNRQRVAALSIGVE
jgi:LPPG:FO 2-phospho-L-lactate transferase